MNHHGVGGIHGLPRIFTRRAILHSWIITEAGIRNQDNFCLMQSLVYEKYYNKRPPRTGEGGVCNGGAQIFFAESDTFKRGDDVFRRSGVVDGMRIPKDAFGCNKTMWSNTPELWTDGHPAVYLPGHWNYPAGTVKPIYVFVSPGIEKVSVAVNGKDVGECKRTNQFLFTCEKVAWEPGVIKAIGFDKNGKAVAEMSHETVGDPVELQMSVIQSPTGLRADGSDMVIIQTEVVDSQGTALSLGAKSDSLRNVRSRRVAGWPLG